MIFGEDEMKISISTLVLTALVCLLSTGCGMKMMVKGRVVDAVTGQPVEGAVVAIKWVHEKIDVPGLPTPKELLGTTEIVTDAQGDFTIPRYIGFRRRHYMGIYKKGYICWNSEDIFNPYGKTYDEMYPKRIFSVQNDMVIQLQPMPDDIPSEQRKQHGCFTGSVRSQLNAIGIFYKAVKHEDELCFKKSN
jgi:hypothetical protein